MASKLSKAERAALSFIKTNGPGALPTTNAARTPAHISRLVAAGYLETLNRLRAGPQIYEITAAGRAALTGGEDGLR